MCQVRHGRLRVTCLAKLDYLSPRDRGTLLRLIYISTAASKLRERAKRDPRERIISTESTERNETPRRNSPRFVARLFADCRVFPTGSGRSRPASARRARFPKTRARAPRQESAPATPCAQPSACNTNSDVVRSTHTMLSQVLARHCDIVSAHGSARRNQLSRATAARPVTHIHHRTSLFAACIIRNRYGDAP